MRPNSQKMVFWFCLGKSWFQAGKPTLLGKGWFWREKPTFSENQLFPSKNKKPKHHLLGHDAARLQKDCFLGFPQEKVGFPAQNHHFPRKKLVFLSETIFFLAKNWFFMSKLKTIFFLGKVRFFLPKTIFFQESWFFLSKPIFSQGKPKFIFLESGRIVYQKNCLCLFCFSWQKSLFSGPKPSCSQEKLVFHAKTIFFLGNFGIQLQKLCFPRTKFEFLSKTF